MIRKTLTILSLLGLLISVGLWGVSFVGVSVRRTALPWQSSTLAKIFEKILAAFRDVCVLRGVMATARDEDVADSAEADDFLDPRLLY